MVRRDRIRIIALGLTVTLSLLLLANTAIATGGTVTQKSASRLSTMDDTNRTFVNNSTTIEQGDVASIPMSLGQADAAALRIGDWNETLYEVGLNLTAEPGYQGEQFNLELNSYTAGGGGIEEELDNSAGTDLVFSTTDPEVHVDVTYRKLGMNEVAEPRHFGPTETISPDEQLGYVLPEQSYKLSARVPLEHVALQPAST
ncbi:MAG: hypothetical protein U5K37_00590 [Natrialbaceae archaeon]|nr:hypothetical protein [Natrialbaceae archaeon]